MQYTVVGGNGFIGANIVTLLREEGYDVWVPKRNDRRIFSQPLGIVIYCAGHGDCQQNYLKVLESNTILLAKIIESGIFERLIYLSSTRVYMDKDESNESCDLIVSNKDSRRLFNLTKLVSEELLLKSQKDVVILRPSNVYGLAITSPLFLPSIIRDAINNGKVDMFVSPLYEKDYVSVHDVAQMTITIANDTTTSGEIFNIASGTNTSAKDIAKVLIDKTGCTVKWHEVTDQEHFPITSIEKISNKFEFHPCDIINDLSLMINAYKNSTKT